MARAAWNGEKFLEIKNDVHGWWISARNRDGQITALPSRTDFAADDWKLVQPFFDIVHPQVFSYYLA